MRSKKHSLKSSIDSELLFMISDSKVYPSGLSRMFELCKIKKNPVVLSKQLKRLSDEEYLIFLNVKGQPKNRMFYEINWNTIIKDFVEYLIDERIKKNDFKFEGTEIRKKFVELAQKNFFMNSLFRNLFVIIKNIYWSPYFEDSEEAKLNDDFRKSGEKGFSIYDVFTVIKEQNMLLNHAHKLKKLVKKDIPFFSRKNKDYLIYELLCDLAQEYGYSINLHEIFSEKELDYAIISDYDPTLVNKID